MKLIIRLVAFGSAATAALALAGNALATPKLSVRQASTSLTVRVSQAQSDPAPARTQIFVPTGYTLNTSQAPGTRVGTVSGTVFAKDLNISVPSSGNVVVAPPDTTVTGCATGTHLAVWLLQLSVAGQNLEFPVLVDPTAGQNASFGAYQLAACFPPVDVPQGTPGRSPSGATLVDATLTLSNVFTPPTGATVWKALVTPYAAGTGAVNTAGTVELRSSVRPGLVTLVTRLLSRKTRTLRVSGTVTQAGAGVAGQSVNLLLNGKARFRARTTARGLYTILLRKTGRRSTTIFQARVTVAERDITTSGCQSPTRPGVRCVSATAAGFTALSRKIRVQL
jgi:hypothetical protein